MAVRLEFSLPKKLHSSVSTVKNLDDTIKTTLDHVRRIHNDHDYLKHSSPNETNEQETAIVKQAANACDGKIKSNIQGSFVTCGSHDVKDGKNGDFPNEGIQASDLCSLLDKFEEAFNNSPSVLTPATSPGHSDHCKEPLSLKINSHVNTTALTPPTTPPVQELTELFPNDCKPSVKLQKKATELLAKRIIASKDKALNKKVKKVQQKTDGNGSLNVSTLPVEKVQEIDGGKKRKSNDTVADSKVCSAKKVKLPTDKKNQVQSSKVCQESKIELAVMKETGNVRSPKTVEDSVEKTKSETLRKVNCPNAVDLNDEKSSELNKSEKDIEHGVQEMLNDKKCSNIGDVNNKYPNNIDRGDDKLQNDNKNNEKIDIHRTANNNNDEITEEKIQNDIRRARKDANDREDNYRRKSGDTEGKKRKSDDCCHKYKDDERKRKHRSRSLSVSSDDDDSSSDERSNPRKSERYHKRHSDSGRKSEKYRRYHSRDDEKYSDDERGRHRSSDYHRRHDDYHHDDRRHDDRHHSKYERKDRKYFRDIEHERKIDFRLGRSNIRDNAKGERRVIYVGGLPYGTTRDELRDRFRKFGPIEKVTVHLRVGERDNYGFVTFFEPEDALQCVERGNSDPSKPHFDLCFGGRRQFCGGSYVDFDSTMSTIEEMAETCEKVGDDVSEDDDFDSLLRMCQEGLGR